MSVSSMLQYSGIVAVKSFLHNAAELNEVEGLEELEDDDWRQLYEYSVALYDKVNELPDDKARVQFLLEGVMLHVLLDYIDQGR